MAEQKVAQAMEFVRGFLNQHADFIRENFLEGFKDQYNTSLKSVVGLPFNQFADKAAFYGAVVLSLGVPITVCAFTCCSRGGKQAPAKKQNKKNKNKGEAQKSPGAKPDSDPCVASTNGTSKVQAPQAQPAPKDAPVSNGTSCAPAQATEAVVPDVTNTTAKQLLKIRRTELHQLTNKKSQNNKERRRIKKLTTEIEMLNSAPINKNGMVKYPESFLDTKPEEEVKEQKPSGTPTKNKNSETNLIDLQNTHGLTMEQAAQVAIAKSLQTTLDEDDMEGFQTQGKKKKSPNTDGWTTVKKK